MTCADQWENGRLDNGMLLRVTRPEADFSYIFSGENFGENSAENFSPKCWEKMEFSEEKVLKNHFYKKFHGMFRGK
jgi:hypothetical protein